MHPELIREAAKIFPEVADQHSIESARIWHCKYRTLEPIKEFTNLRVLDVARRVQILA